MPIRSLIVEPRAAAFPKLGTLRKGGVKSERAPGRDLDHFRFDTEDAQALADFTQIFGAEPRTVRVVLPFTTMEQNFEIWKEAYTAGALQHRCDGETCVLWLDRGRYSREPVPCLGGCREVGRLTVIIPELKRMAHVTVETHSVNDILQLQRNILAIETWRGDVRGIVWNLSRKPVQVSTPRGDKRVRVEKWLLFLEPMAQYAASLLTATTQAALAGGAVRALPDGGNASTATGEIFEADVVDADAPETPGQLGDDADDVDPTGYDRDAHLEDLYQVREKWRALDPNMPKLKGRDVDTPEKINARIDEAAAAIAKLTGHASDPETGEPAASYEPVDV